MVFVASVWELGWVLVASVWGLGWFWWLVTRLVLVASMWD